MVSFSRKAITRMQSMMLVAVVVIASIAVVGKLQEGSFGRHLSFVNLESVAEKVIEGVKAPFGFLKRKI